MFLVSFMQYIPHLMKGKRQVFHRFAVIFSVVIVWIYAHLLTVGGAYKNTGINTEISCRTDRSGLIGGSPWLENFLSFIFVHSIVDIIIFMLHIT